MSNLVEETNMLRTSTTSYVSCGHRRYDICHRCMERVLNMDHIKRNVFFRAFINRREQNPPGIKPTEVCGKCGSDEISGVGEYIICKNCN